MGKYAIVFGSDMFVGTNGILTVEIEGKMIEFFKIREIHRVRSIGSYLSVDCDIKDNENHREVKLAKSRPVVTSDTITVHYDHRLTHVTREDGSTVIKIEQIESDDPSLPKNGPVYNALHHETFDAVIRITGDFFAGPFHLKADEKILHIGGISLSGNLMVGTGGLRLTSMGFAM